jgi:DNA-binding NarL/FixJ family response regulator
MKQLTEGPFKQTFSLDNLTGRFLKEQPPPVPLFQVTRRFSCVFLSASAQEAAKLNTHLSAAGIRAYHAADTREVALLSALTRARILLIDIDCMFEPGLTVLERLDRRYPNLPKVVLTDRDEDLWSLILPGSAVDVVPKPVRLGGLLNALEHAHLVEQELNDPERVRIREMRVMAAIRTASQPGTLKHIHWDSERTTGHMPLSIRHSIRVRLSAMMGRVTHVWRRLGCQRAPKQHSHA